MALPHPPLPLPTRPPAKGRPPATSSTTAPAVLPRYLSDPEPPLFSLDPTTDPAASTTAEAAPTTSEAAPDPALAALAPLVELVAATLGDLLEAMVAELASAPPPTTATPAEPAPADAGADAAEATAEEREDDAQAEDAASADADAVADAQDADATASGGEEASLAPPPAPGDETPAEPATAAGANPQDLDPASLDLAEVEGGPEIELEDSGGESASDDPLAAEAPADAALAGVGSGAGVDAIRQRIVADVAASPPPRVMGAGGRAATQVQTEAQQQVDHLHIVEAALPASAEQQVPPLPADLPVPAPTPQDPVPQARRTLDLTAGHVLTTWTPPTFERSPLGNQPRLGARPRDESLIDQAHAFAAQDPQQSLPLDDPRREMTELRREMLYPDPVPTAQAQPPAIVARPVPPPVTTPEVRSQATEVIASLLDQPDEQARRMFDRVRGTVFAGGDLHGHETYGDDQFLPELTPALTTQFLEIARGAGVAAQDLDNAISRRRATAAQAAQAAQDQLAQCMSVSMAAVGGAGASVQSTIATEHERILAHTDAARAAELGGGADGQVRAVRERLLNQLRQREAALDAGYRMAGSERDRLLTEALTSQTQAYQAVQQLDEFQLNEVAVLPTARQSELTGVYQRELGHATALPTTLSAAESSDLLAACGRWSGDRIRAATATITARKRSDAATIQAWRDVVSDAGKSARDQVRDWAAGALHETRALWTQLFEWVQDWVARAQANAEAWQAAQNQVLSSRLTHNLDLFNQLDASVRSGITREQLLDNNTLDARQRRIFDRYFATQGQLDPFQLMAQLLVDDIYEQRSPELITRLRGEFESDGKLSESDIDGMVGYAVSGRASSLYAAFHGTYGIPVISEAGTDEDAVYAALEGLTSLQRLGLTKIYFARYGVSIEADIKDEMSKGERDRALGLLEGSNAEAAAGALYAAMHQTFWNTGLGTDKDVIFNVLGGLTPEEREEAIRIYEQRYGGNLRDELRDELDDWATRGSWDADRAIARLESRDRDADAIELNQLSYGTIFHTSTVHDMGGVYERIRTQVDAEAERGNWSSARRNAELRHRLGEVETAHDARYNSGGEHQTGTLRDAFTHAAEGEARFRDALVGGPERLPSTVEHRQASIDYLNGMADNDQAKVDAARLRIERASLVYADDAVVTGTYRGNLDRATTDARLDLAPAMRRRLMAQLEREEEANGRPFSAAERHRRELAIETEIDLTVRNEGRSRAESAVRRMESTYAARYGESVELLIEQNTSGRDRDMARLLHSQGGHLTPYQQFEIAVGGDYDGTREELASEAFRGLSRAEIEEADREWRRRHHGESILDRARNEMDGRDLHDFELAWRGRPETIEDEIGQLRERVRFERPTNAANALIAAREREIMMAHLASLEAMRPDMYRTDLTREQRDRMLGGWTARTAVAGQAIDSYRTRREAITDGIVNAIGIVVAVVVGAVVSFFTAGAAAPVFAALIASLASTAVTIGAKAVLMGNAYGAEDILTDVGIGVIDAVVAMATAGIGDKLLGPLEAGVRGAATAARQATATGMRGAWQRITLGFGRFAEKFGAEGVLARRLQPSRLLNRLATSNSLWRQALAHGVAQTAENFIQSLPTSLVSAAIQGQVWEGEGNPLTKILGGTMQSMGPGLAMGAGFQLGGAAFGRISRAAHWLRHGPALGEGTHLRSAEHLRPGHPEYEARLQEYRHAFPGADEGEFRARLEDEARGHQAAFERQQGQRLSARAELEAVLPPDVRALAGDLPVSVVSGPDFRRLNGMRAGDALVVVRDGQVHVVVRDGAPAHGIRAQLEGHLATIRSIEPGTGGRVADPRAALPRDLRGRMPVRADPSLPPRTVRVLHEPTPHLVIGPGVRAADIHQHVQTMRNVMQLHGAYGAVRHLLDRAADWVFLHGEPPQGTRAWEARQELRKLPEIIQARLHEAAHPDLTSHERAALEAEVAHLEHQLARHKRTLADFDLEPGRGFIAAEGVAPRPLAELDAAHEAWMQRMLAHVRGDGPPPLPWTGPEPRLDHHGSWRGHDPAAAYAAYRVALAEGGGQYEAGIFRDRLSGEYVVVLGSRGSVSGPGDSAGRSWETVMHFHPNAENAARYTLPAPQDAWLAMTTLLDHGAPVNRPHIEFVESIRDGQRTRVAIVSDRTSMNLELGRGVASAEAGPVTRPVRDIQGEYQRWWGAQGRGGPAPMHDPREGSTWVAPGSQEHRALLREAATALGHPEVSAHIDATAPERAGMPAEAYSMAALANPPLRPDQIATLARGAVPWDLQAGQILHQLRSGDPDLRSWLRENLLLSEPFALRPDQVALIMGGSMPGDLSMHQLRELLDLHRSDSKLLGLNEESGGRPSGERGRLLIEQARISDLVREHLGPPLGDGERLVPPDAEPRMRSFGNEPVAVRSGLSLPQDITQQRVLEEIASIILRSNADLEHLITTRLGGIIGETAPGVRGMVGIDPNQFGGLRAIGMSDADISRALSVERLMGRDALIDHLADRYRQWRDVPPQVSKRLSEADRLRWAGDLGRAQALGALHAERASIQQALADFADGPNPREPFLRDRLREIEASLTHLTSIDLAIKPDHAPREYTLSELHQGMRAIEKRMAADQEHWPDFETGLRKLVADFDVGGGRRPDLVDPVYSLRDMLIKEAGGVRREPAYGRLQGHVLDVALHENMRAIAEMREALHHLSPDAILAVERGGWFLGDVLTHNDPGLAGRRIDTRKRVGELPDQRIHLLGQSIREAIFSGRRSFVVVDVYMGGVFAGELDRLFTQIATEFPHLSDLSMGVLWLREGAGFEGALHRLPGGGFPLQEVKGISLEFPDRIFQGSFPVRVVLGDDMKMILDPRQPQLPIRIFDRNGVIVRTLRPFETRDPTSGRPLNAREILIRLMRGEL